MRLYRTYQDPTKKGYTVRAYIPSETREFRKYPFADLKVRRGKRTISLGRVRLIYESRIGLNDYDHDKVMSECARLMEAL